MPLSKMPGNGVPRRTAVELFCTSCFACTVRAMGSERPTVLIVDDNAANRAYAKATLEDEGYEALVASDGA